MFGILAMNVGDENAVAVLDFIVKTVVKVFHPPFRLAQAHGGIVIFIDDFFDKDREATSATCVDLGSRGAFCLAFDFRFGAAGRTLRWTYRPPKLIWLSINLRVVFAAQY